MSETNSRIGKAIPVEGNGARNNHAPVSQSSATVYGERAGWILALVIGVLALAVALFVAFTLWRVSQDLQQIRGELRQADARAGDIKGRADLAYELAQKAEREGRLAEEAAMHLRGTMRAYGIAINPGGINAGIAEDMHHEEPIEP